MPIDWAFKSALVNADKVGLTGFCWGGRITWLYAAHNPKLKAGVAWYGRLVGTANELTPKYPIDIASALTVPILGLYGGKDTSIPLNTLNQMRNLLKSSSSNLKLSFTPMHRMRFADYRPSYREAEAKSGWQRLQAWFNQHGV
jgi:carboxymethylenebutenolidase